MWLRLEYDRSGNCVVVLRCHIGDAKDYRRVLFKLLHLPNINEDDKRFINTIALNLDQAIKIWFKSEKEKV